MWWHCHYFHFLFYFISFRCNFEDDLNHKSSSKSEHIHFLWHLPQVMISIKRIYMQLSAFWSKTNSKNGIEGSVGLKSLSNWGPVRSFCRRRASSVRCVFIGKYLVTAGEIRFTLVISYHLARLPSIKKGLWKPIYMTTVYGVVFEQLR